MAPPPQNQYTTTINALIAAVEAIEKELGINPRGIYADVRIRLDVLEARGGGGPSVDGAVIFDDVTITPTSNIRSNRSTSQSPIDNTQLGIINLGSDTSLSTVGITASYSSILGGDQNQVQNSYSSVVGGFSNNINGGSFSIISGGSNNIISNDGSFIGCGDSNNVSGTGSAILIGLTNTLSSGYSTILAGTNNTINTGADYSTILSGSNNFISTVAGYSAILGGNANTINSGSQYGLIFGASNLIEGNFNFVQGQENVSTAGYGMAHGYNANSRLSGQYSHSSFSLGGLPGDTQYSRLMLYGDATSGGAITLTLNGGSSIILESGKAYDMCVRILVSDLDNLDNNARFIYDILAHYDAGAFLDNVNATLITDSGTGWTVSFGASGDFIVITVDAFGVNSRRAMATVEWRELQRGT